MRIPTLVRTAVAGLCATVLVATPGLVSTASAEVDTSSRALPTLKAKIKGTSVTLRGTKGLRAGHVKLVVTGKSDTSVTFGRLDSDYSFDRFRKDLMASFTKNDMKALKRVYAKADAIGGLAPGSSGTITFPRAGEYFAFVFGDRGMGKPVMFQVGAKRQSKAPSFDGKVVADDGPSWRGSAMLPAKGTLLLKNASSKQEMHFLELQQVVEGTTVDQVLESFQSESQGPPEWALPGHLITDVISQGRSMTVNYDLPPGQYVALCFMPDPKMGMPHSFMGMIKMIHVM